MTTPVDIVALSPWRQQASAACETQRVAVRGVGLEFFKGSWFDDYRIRTIHHKEPETLDWLESHLKPSSTFIDIGANIGVFTIYAAAKCPDAIVHAFEPAPHNVARLLENVRLNRLRNVTVWNCALGRKPGPDCLFLSSYLTGGSMHSLGDAAIVRRFGQEVLGSCGVMVGSLDDLIGAGRVPVPTLLKIDVDGLEQDVMAGAERTLIDRRVETVLIEENWAGMEPNDSPVVSAMARFGFIQISQCGAASFGNASWRNRVFSRPA